MGESKAHLPFRGHTMAQQVMATMNQVVRPIVAVAASGQQLPELPSATVVRDERPACGPLEGMRIGLHHLADQCDAAYISSCDVPLLRAEFIRHLVQLLDDRYDAVVPFEGEFAHPLAAVYRTSLLPIVEQLVRQERWRPRFLIDQVRTLAVDVQQLRNVDPDLQSLMNINRPEDYRRILNIGDPLNPG